MVRVMVVEDHEMMRLAIAEALNDEDEVEVVAVCVDGQEATEVIDAARPDVVVTDLSMPRLDGAQLTRRVLQSRPDTRVLVLTAQPRSALAAQAVDAGAHQIIGKTGDIGPLIEAVRRHARGTPPGGAGVS